MATGTTFEGNHNRSKAKCLLILYNGDAGRLRKAWFTTKDLARYTGLTLNSSKKPLYKNIESTKKRLFNDDSQRGIHSLSKRRNKIII